jgi:hypothetical protein
LSSKRTAPSVAGVLLVALVGTGCSDSDPLADEAAGERYVQRQLERMHPSRAPHEIAVLCRETGSRALACGSMVIDARTDGAEVRQRWTVTLDRSRQITEARPITSRAASEDDPPRSRRVERRMEVVRLRMGPRRRVLICVDTGRGRRLFGTTRMAALSLKRARLRLEVRRRRPLIAVRGRPRAARGLPHGVDIRPGRLRPLRSRDRRC